MDWAYGYNSRGEVTSATRGGRSFSYAYDGIGNRTSASDSEAGAITYPAASTNALNQYTAIINPDPGQRVVKGQANADATVSVTQSTPGLQPANLTVTRDGTAFSATATAATTTAPAFAKVIIEGRKAGAGAEWLYGLNENPTTPGKRGQ